MNKAYKEPVYWFVKKVLFGLYRFFFRIEFYRSENVPNASNDRGVILASNHASYLDPPAVGFPLERPVTYLAKAYLFRVPVLGWLLESLGVLPIKTGRADDLKSIRDLLKALKGGLCVAVFPEGTRSSDGRLQEAERGAGFLAAKSHSWVVPIYIHGTFEACPKGARWFKGCPISVHFGEPFIPADDRGLMAQADPYMAVSQKIMEEIRKVKDVSEQSPAREPLRQGQPYLVR